MAVKNHPQGQVLSRWLLVVRAVLFPLDTFYWRMSKTRGYDWQTDSWNIEGVRLSGASLRMLSKAAGGFYQIDRDGDLILIELASVDVLKRLQQ
tara:strand:+ start:464 stop:745 length:282 start_codon:yes stop_codon:yes gene_type:complete